MPADYAAYAAKQEEVKQLKREQRHAEAVRLLWDMASETEADVHSGQRDGVDSWPYLNLAIIYRKEGDLAAEIAALEHFARLPNSHSKRARDLLQRLVEVYGKAGRVVERDGGWFDVQSGMAADEFPIFHGAAAFVDTETTGLSNDDELIELAVALFRFSRLSGRILGVVDSYTGLREPGCPIHPIAQKAHGITARQLRGQCIDDQRALHLLRQAEFLLAHNASFDRRFICALYPDLMAMPWYCSMKGIQWNTKGFDSKGLQELLAVHQIQTNRAHRAMDDVLSALDLLNRVDRDTGSPYMLELLDAAPLRPPRQERSSGPITATIHISAADIFPDLKTKKPQKKSFLERLMFWR